MPVKTGMPVEPTQLRLLRQEAMLRYQTAGNSMRLVFMRFRLVTGRHLLSLVTLALLLGTSSCSGLVNEKQTEQFFADLGNTSITIYPTYIKRMARDELGKPLGYDAFNSGYEHKETERLAAYLRCECLAQVVVGADKVTLGGKWQKTQYGIFKASSRAFADYVAAHPIDTEYAMMAEYAIPLDRVWAVHAYVVNAKGELVWILHLNEHFEVFTDFNPKIPAEATDVLLEYLRTGWPDTSAKCTTQMTETRTRNTPAGILYDFESELPAGFDSNGIPLGFSTFDDGNSTVKISRTNDHPPRQGEAAGNTVLKLDVNVAEWAGVVNTFENQQGNAWTPRDWSAHDGFSFWLYGNNSGTSLYVDLIDNRKSCSTYDDGERFTVSFIDDFSGWKKMTVRFSDMARRDIGNRAPNDGLGLTHVHGWGLGVLKTGGPTTYYIDDFELHTGKAEH